VVWEPILATDWSRPSGIVQSRIADPRVIQYWDHDHLVAEALRHQFASEPSCCQRKGILWDLAVLYGKQAQWGNSSPVFADGPVVDAAAVLDGLQGFRWVQEIEMDNCAGSKGCSPNDLTGRKAAWLLWYEPILLVIVGFSWNRGRVWLWVPAFLVMSVGCLANASMVRPNPLLR
jgi:hypothetical protein